MYDVSVVRHGRIAAKFRATPAALDRVAEYYGVDAVEPAGDLVRGIGAEGVEVVVYPCDRWSIMALEGAGAAERRAFGRVVLAWLKQALTYEELDPGSKITVAEGFSPWFHGQFQPVDLPAGTTFEVDGFHVPGADKYFGLPELPNPYPEGTPAENVRIRLRWADPGDAQASGSVGLVVTRDELENMQPASATPLEEPEEDAPVVDPDQWAYEHLMEAVPPGPLEPESGAPPLRPAVGPERRTWEPPKPRSTPGWTEELGRKPTYAYRIEHQSADEVVTAYEGRGTLTRIAEVAAQYGITIPKTKATDEGTALVGRRSNDGRYVVVVDAGDARGLARAVVAHRRARVGACESYDERVRGAANEALLAQAYAGMPRAAVLRIAQSVGLGEDAVDDVLNEIKKCQGDRSPWEVTPR